ncbi:MAG: hypothetical protein ACI9J3_001116 [Parvicellaceae bacterium]|jgi:hypothetical protein
MKGVLSISLFLIFHNLSYSQHRLLEIDTILVKYDESAHYQLETDSVWLTDIGKDIYGSRGRKNVYVFRGLIKGNLPWDGTAWYYGMLGESMDKAEYYKNGKRCYAQINY